MALIKRNCDDSLIASTNQSSLCQSMILLKGYSTIPRAPPCLSCGTMWRTVFSSMMVLTATQVESARDEIVGVCKAGRTSGQRKGHPCEHSSSAQLCPRRPWRLAA